MVSSIKAILEQLPATETLLKRKRWVSLRGRRYPGFGTAFVDQPPSDPVGEAEGGGGGGMSESHDFTISRKQIKTFNNMSDWTSHLQKLGVEPTLGGQDKAFHAAEKDGKTYGIWRGHRGVGHAVVSPSDAYAGRHHFFADLKEQMNEGSSDKVFFKTRDEWVKHHRNIGHEIQVDTSPEGIKMGRLTSYDPHIQPGASNYGLSGHWFDKYPDGRQANFGSSNYTEDGFYMNQESVTGEETDNALLEGGVFLTRTNRIRRGQPQRNKKITTLKGYKVHAGRPVRMKMTEIRHRMLSQRIGARKRRLKLQRALIKRARSIRRRQMLGF